MDPVLEDDKTVLISSQKMYVNSLLWSSTLLRLIASDWPLGSLWWRERWNGGVEGGDSRGRALMRPRGSWHLCEIKRIGRQREKIRENEAESDEGHLFEVLLHPVNQKQRTFLSSLEAKILCEVTVSQTIRMFSTIRLICTYICTYKGQSH